MAFKRKDAESLLAQCHRRCCICHRFCGSKMELDHMIPSADGGSDDIENAIPVCFDCHAEIHAYNTRHPRGRKFSGNELRKHKKQWLAICENSLGHLSIETARTATGPLEALANELEFNRHISGCEELIRCYFMDQQFVRATALGAIWTLSENARNAVFETYGHINSANNALQRRLQLLPENPSRPYSSSHGGGRPAPDKALDNELALARNAVRESLAVAYPLLIEEFAFTSDREP